MGRQADKLTRYSDWAALQVSGSKKKSPASYTEQMTQGSTAEILAPSSKPSSTCSSCHHLPLPPRPKLPQLLACLGGGRSSRSSCSNHRHLQPQTPPKLPLLHACLGGGRRSHGRCSSCHHLPPPPPHAKLPLRLSCLGGGRSSRSSCSSCHHLPSSPRPKPPQLLACLGGGQEQPQQQDLQLLNLIYQLLQALPQSWIGQEQLVEGTALGTTRNAVVQTVANLA
jgi:hypothetical protein